MDLEHSKPPQLSSSSTRATDASTGSSYGTSTSLAQSLEQAARAVVDDVCWLVSTGCCVDEHTADQLLLYMAHAQGQSRVKCAPEGTSSSLHIATCVKIISDMKDVSFDISSAGGVDGCRIITCSGSGPTAATSSS
jgi:RNA 3'-terminal phosphate cyclase (ATP)